ncbi:MAG TPA: SMI1/KNR4 family protein [Archangium sp.]|uniref:SMI1/KNR4 family protein n=1 Tax=Archangium sp. TaxID=1872627 RepID=UPI002E376BC1|nr:SMI1/KNR4 family protein [Archangium sp.]HEX5744721.1 SMI1/KNR4 family protein [Archangium sp.]
MTFNELSELLESNLTKSFGQGVSDAEIDTASAELQVELTGGYRLFLKRFGWGGVGSIELFGLGVDVPPYLSLTEMTRSEREEMSPALPTHLIPLMNDGGGNLYCLDSRGAGEPPVVFWDHTAGEQQEPARVASDFTTWLAERVEREMDVT